KQGERSIPRENKPSRAKTGSTGGKEEKKSKDSGYQGIPGDDGTGNVSIYGTNYMSYESLTNSQGQQLNFADVVVVGNTVEDSARMQCVQLAMEYFHQLWKCKSCPVRKNDIQISYESEREKIEANIRSRYREDANKYMKEGKKDLLIQLKQLQHIATKIPNAVLRSLTAELTQNFLTSLSALQQQINDLIIHNERNKELSTTKLNPSLSQLEEQENLQKIRKQELLRTEQVNEELYRQDVAVEQAIIAYGNSICAKLPLVSEAMLVLFTHMLRESHVTEPEQIPIDQRDIQSPGTSAVITDTSGKQGNKPGLVQSGVQQAGALAQKKAALQKQATTTAGSKGQKGSIDPKNANASNQSNLDAEDLPLNQFSIIKWKGISISSLWNSPSFPPIIQFDDDGQVVIVKEEKQEEKSDNQEEPELLYEDKQGKAKKTAAGKTGEKQKEETNSGKKDDKTAQKQEKPKSQAGKKPTVETQGKGKDGQISDGKKSGGKGNEPVVDSQTEQEQFSPEVEALNTDAHQAVIQARDAIFRDCVDLFRTRRNTLRMEMSSRHAEKIESWKDSWEWMVNQLVVDE
ncbi:MAG: hypothetical protein EZS28_035445, partial [Streblomastix strix]